MSEVIDRFATRDASDQLVHSPLSNFSASPMEIHGVTWPTVEHYFQGMKTQRDEEREAIRAAPTPGQAKHLGGARSGRCHLRANWEEIKIPVMRMGLRHKFVPSNADGRYLLNTGNALLIEGNDWGDKFWGCVRGLGENWLGHLLMARRAEIRYLEVPAADLALVRTRR